MSIEKNSGYDVQISHALVSLLMNAPGPACIADFTGTVILANDYFKKVFHIPPGSRDLKINIFSEDSPFSPAVKEIININDGIVSSAWKKITISPADGEKRNLIAIIIPFSDEKSGHFFFFSGCDITAEDLMSPEESRTNMLHDLINEIVRSNHLGQHPNEQLQYVIGRVGKVMNVQYSSYLEIDENIAPFRIYERYLWSADEGFLFGNEIEVLRDDHTFFTIFEELKSNKPKILRKHEIHGFIRKIFDKRKSGTLLLVPLTRELHLTGILAFWEKSDSREWMHPELTTLLVLAGIIETCCSKHRIEEVLEKSEQKFQSLIDRIGDMYFMTDKSGLLIRVSPSMAKNLGFSSVHSLLGTSLENMIHPPEFWPVFLSDIISEEGVKDYEIQLATSDNQIIFSSISCRLVYDDDGELLGIEGVIRDITRRKQYGDLLSDLEWKLEQAQKIARMGVWSYDSNLERFRVSQEVFSLLGIPKDQNYVVFNDFISRTYPPDKNKFLHFFPLTVSHGKDFDFEFRISLDSGKFRYLRMKGTPLIKRNVIQGSYGILQDITERKDVENHLMKYATELEEKTMELDAMRTQLLDMNRDLDDRVRKRTVQIEDLLKQKDEFIQIIGHDLKTPLTPLVAILPYIRKRITDPELGELLDNSIEDVSTIRKLVTTILDLAQMNSLYMLSDIQEIYVKEIIDQVINDNAYLIHQKSLHLVNDTPDFCQVFMSPIHFETVLGNLIGNAVKYSFIDGNVTINVVDQEDSVLITIKDEGIGIEPEQIPRVFEDFYRADNSRHERGSHGLGLAITKRVVEMYHGTIAVESGGVGKGSVFSLQLKKNPEIFLKKREGLIHTIKQQQRDKNARK
ncbi:PAS domain-containing sensor histidine kinase [Methanospirillum sp.]|uniref:sensor histidine kinase n=1 Tax=Methanospirillum sp. TaxID=45200 RepID=UPI002D1F9F28|nr:PAS domain-containing sensor histidine kinase [Methanospirillum sp.]